MIIGLRVERDVPNMTTALIATLLSKFPPHQMLRD